MKRHDIDFMETNSNDVGSLRAYIEKYPYCQTARIQLLRTLKAEKKENLVAAVADSVLYVTDNKIIVDLLKGHVSDAQRIEVAAGGGKSSPTSLDNESKPLEALANTLADEGNDAPADAEERLDDEQRPRHSQRVDPASDYVGYILQQEQADGERKVDVGVEAHSPLNGERLIDDFIKQQSDGIVLRENSEYTPAEIESEQEPEAGETCFTETLAKIYIKQGRFENALEIIKKLMLNNPKKNSYFADQIRFLEKLIENNKQKK